MGIPQYKKFVGVKGFMKEIYPAAFDILGESGALDLISDTEPEEIALDMLRMEAEPGTASNIKKWIARFFGSGEEYSEKAAEFLQRMIRGV